MYSPSKALEQAIAGLSAGALSTLICHPLDLLKIRLQVDEKARNSSIPMLGKAIRTSKGIIRNEGFLGLYRGLSPNIVGSTISWGLYFWWYDLFKQRQRKGVESKTLTAPQHLLASAEAGIITQFMTNPIWVVKTRMCADGKAGPEAYRGLINGLTSIFKKEGVLGFYRGVTPSLFGVTHGAFQFMAYEEMKKIRLSHKSLSDQNLNTLEYMFMSICAKFFASITTYPFQVVRSRLQNQKSIEEYLTLRGVIKKTYQVEGIYGFYKGLGPNLIRVMPATVITFVTYETVSKVVRNR